MQAESDPAARGATAGAADAVAPDGLPRRVLLAGLALSVVVAIAEHVQRGHGYWDYSEGVYLFTSRLLLRGHDLYGSVVAAQPPPLFLIGAGLLAIHDSLEWVRAVIGALQVGTALLAASVVWRVTRIRAAAVVAAPLSLVTPWVLHEHGSLIPEMIAAPLLLGGILLARERRHAHWLGITVALLATVKLSYALPAVALIAVSGDWRRAARWALVAAVLEIAVTFAVFGTAVWRDTVEAQFQSGHIPFHSLVGEFGQIAWHLCGLVVAALLAWHHRRRARDRRTLLVAGTVAFATLITLVSIWKLGTSLNSVVPAEVTLVPLAVSGIALALAGSSGRRAAVIGCAGVAFAVIQALSLVAHPLIEGARPIHPFLRPGSSHSYGITMSAAEVDRAVADARRCPPGVPYPGTPFIAFLAHRRLAGDQADQYLIHLAPALKQARDAMAAEPARCPAQPPATH